MLGLDEENLESTVGPWTQRVVGLLLLLFTALGFWYAVTTLWPGDKPPSTDPRWISIAVLAAMPFLLTLSARLLKGRLRDTQVFPPAALIVTGLLLITAGLPLYAFATNLGLNAARGSLAFLLLGASAVWMGWRKLAAKPPSC